LRPLCATSCAICIRTVRKSVPEVEGLPEFMTPAEVDEVNAEVVRRLYAGIDKMRDRIAARLPHLAEDQLAVLDRELHDSIAPAGKRPEAASGGASRVARARLKGRPVSIPATRRRCGTGATRGRARLKQGATSRGCSLRKCRALPLRRRRCVRVPCLPGEGVWWVSGGRFQPVPPNMSFFSAIFPTLDEKEPTEPT
jgi:copper chaperone CopZ